MKHGASEEPELNAGLNEQREVTEGERLEPDDRPADRVLATVGLGEAHRRVALGGELVDPLADLGPVLVAREVVDRSVGGTREPLAATVADVGVLAVEQTPQRVEVERGGGGSGDR
jgi:hypothetical protein